jgi:hypothetical protein
MGKRFNRLPSKKKPIYMDMLAQGSAPRITRKKNIIRKRMDQLRTTNVYVD